MSKRRQDDDLFEVPVSGRPHRCNVCGAVGPWSSKWSWWGSVKDLDDSKPVVKICSEVCKKGLSAAVLAKMGKQVRADPDFVLRAA